MYNFNKIIYYKTVAYQYIEYIDTIVIDFLTTMEL